jgi:hypothetical protein
MTNHNKKAPQDGANEELYASLDKGIRREAQVLIEGGIETFESCDGSKGHSYPEPTIRFHGEYGEGFRAFAIARNHGLSVSSLRRYYSVEDGELKGPWWEMTFSPTTRT